MLEIVLSENKLNYLFERARRTFFIQFAVNPNTIHEFVYWLNKTRLREEWERIVSSYTECVTDLD